MLKALWISTRKHRHLVCAVVLMGAVGGALPSARQPAPRRLVIEAPNGGSCVAIGGQWNRSKRTCTIRSLTLNAGDTLTIRRRAHLVVEQRFINDGGVTIGDQSTTAELTLGIEPIGGAGLNRGVIILVPSTVAASPGLNNRFNQFVNFNTITNFKTGERGGILNNFGEILNNGRINNRGFLHNSGPRVQTQVARIITQGSGVLSNDQGGIIENLGMIRGPVTGPCPGDCQR
jgi:hypothetical protein